MKKYIGVTVIAIAFFAAVFFIFPAFANQKNDAGYIIEHEKNIANDEPGPHNGGGNSTAYNFFSKAENSNLVFRKRILHAGAAIGYHLQQEEEIYYIVSGNGEMTMNNKIFTVQTGDAILTLPGNSHGLKQTGKEDLVVIIDYEKHSK